jgi:hypothetical protein
MQLSKTKVFFAAVLTLAGLAGSSAMAGQWITCGGIYCRQTWSYNGNSGCHKFWKPSFQYWDQYGTGCPSSGYCTSPWSNGNC